MKITTFCILVAQVSICSISQASEIEPREPISIPYDAHSVPKTIQEDDRIQQEESFPTLVLLGSAMGCAAGGAISIAATVFYPVLFLATYSILTTAGAVAGASVGALLSKKSLPNVFLSSIPGAIAALAAPLAFVGGIFWYFQVFSLTKPLPGLNALLVASLALYLLSGPVVIFLATWTAQSGV